MQQLTASRWTKFICTSTGKNNLHHYQFSTDGRITKQLKAMKGQITKRVR